jgi:hypothetical protein
MFYEVEENTKGYTGYNPAVFLRITLQFLKDKSWRYME